MSDEDLSGLRRTRIRNVKVFGRSVLLGRTGYTGEDGFEIFTAPGDGPAIWDELLGLDITPAGLGARNTLRLEAGMALHGHELGVDINPIEAGLGGVVAMEKGEFVGKAALASVASGAVETAARAADQRTGDTPGSLPGDDGAGGGGGDERYVFTDAETWNRDGVRAADLRNWRWRVGGNSRPGVGRYACGDAVLQQCQPVAGEIDLKGSARRECGRPDVPGRIEIYAGTRMDQGWRVGRA